MFVELPIQLPVPLSQSLSGCEQNEFCVQFLYFGSVSSASWHSSHLWNYSYISWLHQLNLFNVKVTFFSRKWIYWYLMILNKFKIFEWWWEFVGGGEGIDKDQKHLLYFVEVPMVVQRGSILGHQPFFICINDLSSSVSASLIKYADCTKI